MEPLKEELFRTQKIMGIDANEEYVREILFGDASKYLNESQERLEEGLGITGDIITLIKGFLTSQRTGEFLTAIGKLLYKFFGIDTNLNGIKDKCDSDDTEECGKMLIQKLADGLHDIHAWLMEKITYLAAVIKYKTLTPNEIQRREAKSLGGSIMNGILSAILVYYVHQLGNDMYSGEYLHALLPTLGITTKLSELSSVFRKAVDGINQGVGH